MLSKLSVKKPYTVIVGIIMVIALGYISFQHMTTDLLPSMNLPYVVVYTAYPGATPEQVENEITRPMEASFATLTDIKKISSQSRDNVAVVIMQFNDGANMDTALIEISSRLDQLEGSWDDSVGSPVTLKLNPDMLPVAIVSVTHDDMDVLELSDYVTDTLVPSFESLNGVASASASGVITQEVDITIEQSRIDVLNSAILREIDEELADVEQQLISAQAQISDGRRQLARAKSAAYSKIDTALEAIESGESQIGPAIEQLTQQRDALAAQRSQLAAAIAAMERAMNMSDTEKAAVKAAAAQLAALKGQKAELERQLAEAQQAVDAELAARIADARAQRDSLAAERDAQQAYIDDLTLMDADALQAEIADLDAQIADVESRLSGVESNIADLLVQRDQLSGQVDDLTARIQAAEGGAPSDDPSDEPTDEPTDTPTDAPTDDPTDSPSDDPDDGAENDDGSGTSSGSGASDSDNNTSAGNGNDEGKDNSSSENASSGSGKDASPEDAASESGKDASPDGGNDGDAAIARHRPGVALADGEDVDALKAQLASAKSRLESVNAQIDEKNAEADDLRGQVQSLKQTRSSKQNALNTLEGDNENIESRKAEAQRQVDALDRRIAALDQEIDNMNAFAAASSAAAETITAQLEDVDGQLDALVGSGLTQAMDLLEDPDALAEQYAQAQAGLAELDAGIAQMDAMIEKLQRGVIPGGFIDGIDQDTPLSEAKGQLEAAKSMAAGAFSQAQEMLDKAAAEIAKARREFNEKRDEAFEQAGLDGVITVQMVSTIIGAQNFAMPAGYVRDLDSDQVLVRVGDKFATLDELKRMKLFSLGLDAIDDVRLLDVASVAIADDRDDVFTKLDGSDGILLSFDKQSTYSTANVAKTILERAAALQAADPHLHIVDLMNQGEYIDVIVSSVLNNLVSGGILAILILLLFLMDFRPTLTVAFSIPISVVAAFVCMYFTGITLNVLSLSGLSLGIGMLVDNSIVAIENIYRLHEEENLPLLRACVEGVKSVSGALFSSTLTTICVFLPIVFVQGMARDLFADMGLTIAYSLLASLVVAMTVVPMMSSFLMRKSKPKKHRVFSKIQAGYTKLLGGALRFKPLVLIAAVALLAYSAMQISGMGISFMPEVNSRQMSASYAPDAELPLEEHRAQAVEIMNDMLAIDGIQSIGLMDGSGSLLGSGGGYSYYIIVDEDAGVSNRTIADKINAIGEARGASLSAQASTMDISMLTGSGISVEITGDDIETLQAIARDVAEIARQTEGTADVDDGMEDAVPEMRIVVDKEKAIDNGLTTAQVYQFVAQKLMGKIEIGKVTLDGKELAIEMIEGRNSDLTPEDIENFEIEVSGEEEDKMVRIGDISEVRETASLSTIHRTSQRRMVTVSFAVADGYSANLVSDAFEANLANYDVPAGYSIELAGENETVMGIMDDLVWMILIALLLIFLIMVAQFQSFKSPIIVMFTIPLAFTGGMLGLLVTGMDLSIVAMLGFLVLSGVVVNNGIVFIDCVNQLRIGGMEKREALIEAGRQRLRPILMTALTTILGMSTMALGHGTGAEMMQPMAVVSIGGLAYSTLMTLFVVPVMYDIVNGKQMRAREIQMIREAAGMNGDEVLDGLPGGAPDEPAYAAKHAARDAESGEAAPDAAASEAAPASAAAAVGMPSSAAAETPATPVPEAPDTAQAAPEAATAAPEAAVVPDVPPVPVFAPRPAVTPATAKPIRVQLAKPPRRKSRRTFPH